MFVRSRPSQTRSERPIPGDRVPDAFRSLIGAHGAALALVAAYLSRAGTVEARAGTVKADESGRTLGILAVTAAEAIPTEGEVLGARAGIILDGADGRELTRCKPAGGAAGSRG